MTERPIIFSGAMVRAILDGRKTQTRRILKPQPLIDGSGNLCVMTKRGIVNYGQSMSGEPYWRNYPLPYAIGDRLWVRETWAYPLINDSVTSAVVYRADGERTDLNDGRWTPSIHMPKWAARIWLTVTEVRVQRLQDISEEDAYAEGVTHAEHGGHFAREGFETLWNSIHGAGAWAANPWVAAISFERVP